MTQKYPIPRLQDWHVTNDSHCVDPSLELAQGIAVEEPIVPYRLYRFLTDLEDILLKETDDEIRLLKIAPLVRHLLFHSPWIELQFIPPDPKTGWSVSTIYDEPDYPLTIQMVSWMPGSISSIHNHATWGLVAILNGQEKNRFWKRENMNASLSSKQAVNAGQVANFEQTACPLQPTGEKVLQAGDIITFMPDAIHQIEALGDEPVISFNLYGETDYEHRFKFAAETGVATRF